MGQIKLEIKALTGESLTDLQVDASSTVASIVQKLASKVPPPAKKVYTLVLGTDLLSAGDELRKHVSGDSAELIACPESDDSSEEEQQEKAKKDSKSKKAKKKDSKSKSKKDKKKKGKGKSSSDSSDGNKKKKRKKDEKEKGEDKKEEVSFWAEPEDPVAKKAWIAERLNELRQMTPPMPPLHCLERAKKEWIEKMKADEEERERESKEAQKAWPPMVHEAMQEAEDQARKEGKRGAEVEMERAKAAGFALKVAKASGVWVEPEDPNDPRNCPLYFQKRIGLDKAMARIKKHDPKLDD